MGPASLPAQSPDASGFSGQMPLEIGLQQWLEGQAGRSAEQVGDEEVGRAMLRKRLCLLCTAFQSFTQPCGGGRLGPHRTDVLEV